MLLPILLAVLYIPSSLSGKFKSSSSKQTSVMTEVDLDKLMSSLHLITTHLQDSVSKLNTAVDKLDEAAENHLKRLDSSIYSAAEEQSADGGTPSLFPQLLQARIATRPTMLSRAHTTSAALTTNQDYRVLGADLLSPPAPTFQDDKDPFDTLYESQVGR